MINSLTIPSFRVTARLALAPLLAVAKDTRLSLTLLLARACALTIKAHPLFSAVYTPDGLALRERVDVAIAVDTPEGLIAPVIRDVAQRPLTDLATDWRNLREKALSRRLSAQDYQGATFYLSNLGTFSVVYSFDAVLPQGAAAILCVAAADGDRTSFTLGCDHRVLAGADAARFLQTLAEFLAKPKLITETSQASQG
jgi:pyruvate dehydrogenase E2 component (dihydrolipoamide acetyltransferase)